MGSNKLLSLERLLCVLCSKWRVISALGVGLLASLLLLSLLFSVGSNSGAATVAPSPSSLLSWFFPLPGNGSGTARQESTNVWLWKRGDGVREVAPELSSGKVSAPVGETDGEATFPRSNAQGSPAEQGRVSENPRGEKLIGYESTVWVEEGVLKKSNGGTTGARSPDVEGTHAGKSSGNNTLAEGNALKQGVAWAVPLDGNFTGTGNGTVSVKPGVLEESNEGNLVDKLTDRRSTDGEELESPPGKTHMKNPSIQDSNSSLSVVGTSDEKRNKTDLLDGRGNGNLSNGKENKSQEGAGAYRGPTPRMVSSGLERNCDIFRGRWVRDETKPYYPPGSCPLIDRDFDCHANARPDYDFLRWRWQPNDCDIPSLKATDFLKRLRGQRLIFVGDSLNRNMWESLVCILRHSVKKKKRVYEMSGRKLFKTHGYYSFRFKGYNCSVDFVRSPFLVREIYTNSDEKLRLDVMDATNSAYHEADIVVFNTGHWWTHEKTSRGVNYYQEGDHVYPVLKVMEAYKRALSTWARWVDKNINPNKTQVVFRGYSPTHFRGGQWNSGGQCHKETEPIFNESFVGKYPPKMRALEDVLKQMKTPVIYLNNSQLTNYRKDGHPSIYRKEYKSVEEQINAEKTQDCSHWCLPGVPDTWNELLYASLLMVGRGSWKK
uniref:Uncharacterized protein C7orf58 n=1 Tax=Anthurium amnicola TaxID=1678845 RepID=A0A1D1XTB7_9ARAE